MRSVPIKLEPGDDLLISLGQFARSTNVSGFVLGVVGNLSKATFKCPGQPQLSVFEGELEIITLNGTVSPERLHLHLCISDGACQVWGGHLEAGSIVLKGVDLLVGIIDFQHGSQFGLRENSGFDLNQRVEVAVLPECPWSRKAIEILNFHKVIHKVSMINSHQDFQNFQNLSKSSTFPQIFIDGNFIGGYDQLINMEASGQLLELK